MTHPLIEALDAVGGVISSGAHAEYECELCIIELVARARGIEHTDSPEAVNMPDVRKINDAFRDDEARTKAMVRLGIALWDWRDWPFERRSLFSQQVALQTVQQLLPIALDAVGLPEHADVCRGATDLEAARVAAGHASDVADVDSEHNDPRVGCVRLAASFAADAASRDFAYDDGSIALSAVVAGYCSSVSREADSILVQAVDIWVAAAGAGHSRARLWSADEHEQ